MHHIISLGGGVQSTAMFLMACLGQILPKPMCAIFADTGWERQQTYDMIEYLTEYGEKHGIPVYTVGKGNIRDDVLNPELRHPSLPFYINTQRLITVQDQRDELENLLDAAYPDPPSDDLTEPELAIYHEEWEEWHAMKKSELDNFDRRVEKGEITDYYSEPDTAMLRRQCTSDYKIRPITKLVKKLTGCNFKNPATQWIGISIDEIQRMKPPRVKYLKFRYPLVEMKIGRAQCVQWMKDNGFPEPTRSSCIGCPFHDDEEWKSLTPEEFEDACQFDEAKRESGMTHPKTDKVYFSNRVYLHRSMQPLRERPFKEKDPSQMSLFDPKDEACDSGHCFL